MARPIFFNPASVAQAILDSNGNAANAARLLMCSPCTMYDIAKRSELIRNAMSLSRIVRQCTGYGIDANVYQSAIERLHERIDASK